MWGVGEEASSGQKRGCRRLRESGLSQSSQLPIEAFLYLCYRGWQRCVLGSWRGVRRQDEQGSWSTSSHYSVAGGGESWKWLRRSLSTDAPTAGQHCRECPVAKCPSSGVSRQFPISSITRKGREVRTCSPSRDPCKRLWAKERMLGGEGGRESEAGFREV